MSKLIKVHYCVAYDWYLLEHSLPTIYKEADVIVISVAKDLISWTGKPFEFDEEGFADLIKRMDPDRKIQVYRDVFYLPELNPMENEVRQRNMTAAVAGIDHKSWHVQLDADEYFIDFSGFVKSLQRIRSRRPINVQVPLIILFRTVSNGYLWISNSKAEKVELLPIATNRPKYQFGRRNDYFNRITSFCVLHQSWARDESEIQQKILNWGHNQDFDVQAYFHFWKNIDLSNYKDIKNLHPINHADWESLAFEAASGIPELIEKLKSKTLVNFDSRYMMMKNSIWISRLKKYWRSIR